MPVSPSRKIAFEVLRRVEAEGAYASDVLHEVLDASVKPTDAGLAMELTLGVLRWRRLLDALLSRHLKKASEELDLAVALALRMGLYQVRFLEKIPVSAAVNESVELVKRARKSSAAPLVNAVLRKAIAEAKTPAEALLPGNLAQVERLAILHSHPTWMVERWLARLGEGQVIALLAANNQKPRLSCALHDPARRDQVFRDLRNEGMHVEPGVLLKNAFSVSAGSPTRTQAFREGLISIQDEASQAIPLLLGVKRGDRVLDLCAAPGGKTPALACAAGETGVVIAADRHAHRLRAMRIQFQRLKVDHVEIAELDAQQPLPFAGRFDRILVDAPCSGTGTLARHPEIRWRLRPEQFREFHGMQARMLRNALAALAPGGRLVYSTCSMEPEENEGVISEVLNEGGSIDAMRVPALADQLQPFLAGGLDAASLFDGDGFFRTSPAEQHTDGFFAAVLERI